MEQEVVTVGLDLAKNVFQVSRIIRSPSTTREGLTSATLA